jgi:argininosuccinate lyase
VFAARRDTRTALAALRTLLAGLELQHERLAAACADPMLLATDAAEDLVRMGIPFRDAHERVARAVRDGTFAPPANEPPRAAPGPGSIEQALAAARARFGT